MTPNPLNRTPFFVTAYFIAEGNRLQLVQFSDPQGRDVQTINPRGIELSLLEMEAHLKGGTVRVDLKDTLSLPPPLIAHTGRLGCVAAAYVPVLQEGQLRGLILIGARSGQELNDEVIESFERTIRLTTNALTLASSPAEHTRSDRDAVEIRALNVLASTAATANDLNSFYKSIHEQIRSVVGFIKGIQVICCGCGGSKHIQCPYLNSVAIAAGVFGGGAGERECIRGQTYGALERLDHLIIKLLAGSCANQ